MARWMHAQPPPALLSDRVMLDVRLRAKGGDAFVAPSSIDRALPSFNAFQSTLASTTTLSEGPEFCNSPDLKRLRVEAVTPARYGSTRAAEPLFGQLAPTVGEQEDSKAKKRVRVKTERRREQCRANQARYRNKQRQLREEMNGALEKLRKEVQALETRHQALVFQQHAKISPWRIVVDFFRLFRHGPCIRPSSWIRSDMVLGKHQEQIDDGDISKLFEDIPHGEEQLKFLRLSMAPDVCIVGSKQHGVEALVEHWVQWTRCVEESEMLLARIEAGQGLANNALVATASLRILMTDSAVRGLFPHLNTNDIAMQQLSDRQIEIPCSFWFEHDPETKVVTRLRAQFKIVEVFLAEFGSLSEVARVLDRSRLTCNGFLVHESSKSESNSGGNAKLNSPDGVEMSAASVCDSESS